MHRLRQSLRAFARDESGVILAEFLILLPLVIWGLLALFVYWDVFRTINVTQKAAYSISDLLSRQEVVTTDFVEGLQGVLTFLTPGVETSRMRITSFEYDASEDEYVLLFSCSPQDLVAPHTESTLEALRPNIPIMDDLDSMILVETWVDYQPDFDIGILNVTQSLEGLTMTQFIMTRPRHRRVCLAGPPECSPSCG